MSLSTVRGRGLFNYLAGTFGRSWQFYADPSQVSADLGTFSLDRSWQILTDSGKSWQIHANLDGSRKPGFGRSRHIGLSKSWQISAKLNPILGNLGKTQQIPTDSDHQDMPRFAEACRDLRRLAKPYYIPQHPSKRNNGAKCRGLLLGDVGKSEL